MGELNWYTAQFTPEYQTALQELSQKEKKLEDLGIWTERSSEPAISITDIDDRD